MADKRRWFLFRIIIPIFPEVNIFTRVSNITTALGPVMVATAANKNWGWRVEIIDENNYRGPRDSQGLPDHSVLQKESPADMVGFYCGLSSTIERVWQLADFYKKKEAFTVAGSWHAFNCVEETLNHNIDIVVHGRGENIICQIMERIETAHIYDTPFSVRDIHGTSFLKNGKVVTLAEGKSEASALDQLPYPDFGLLRFAKLKWYPISRIRGCRMGCEFCSVKGRPIWASPEHLLNTVKYLSETRRARYFFIVDDRLEEDLEGTMEFFRRIYKKYGNKFRFIVQARLEAAENKELLEAMRKAGVRIVCIGYESPIDEDLKAMRKGYLSSDMLKWTKIWRRFFWVHGMFIAGYPHKKREHVISPKEIVVRFKRFIRKSRLDSIQVLLPGPVVGSALRKRLDEEKRIFPLEIVPWSRYDGNSVCFMPEDMSLKELQEIPEKLMGRFYDPLSFFRVPLRTIAFPIDYFIRGWRGWYSGWCRDIIKCGGSLLVRKRWKGGKNREFVKRLEEYQK